MRRFAIFWLLLLCAYCPHLRAAGATNDVCWSEASPDYAIHLGVDSVVIEYCGVDDQATPNTLRIMAFDAEGAPLHAYGYKATGINGELRETRGAAFTFGDQGDLETVFLNYNDALLNGSLAACASADEYFACQEAGDATCESLGGGTNRVAWSISYVKGSKILSCRHKCTNSGIQWQYSNCTLPDPPPGDPQPDPTCPCEGEPTCYCGG